MAVARTGSISILNTDSSNAGSTSFTVPSGASLAVLCISGYIEAGTHYSTPAAAPTLGGQALTLAKAQDGEEVVKGCAFYLKNPPSGSQTYAWDWAGTTGHTTGGTVFCVYYTGTDATTPIGATGGDQVASGGSVSAGSLANSIDDLVIGFGWAYRTPSTPPGITWSGITEIQDDTQTGGTPGTWLNYGDTAGTGTGITPSTTWTGDDGGVIGIVLKAAGGGGPSIPVLSRGMAMRRR